MCTFIGSEGVYYAYRRFWYKTRSVYIFVHKLDYLKQSYGSILGRKLYTSVNTSNYQANCGFYVDVNFVFNQSSGRVRIDVDGPDNSYIAVGFPNTTFYELTDRSRYLVGGYSILYRNSTNDIQEVNVNEDVSFLFFKVTRFSMFFCFCVQCGACNSDTDYFSVQSNQDISIDSNTGSGGRRLFTVFRDIISVDAEDFSFDMASYLLCNPFLVTVAVGNGFDSWNYLIESYLYTYNQVVETNDQVVNFTDFGNLDIELHILMSDATGAFYANMSIRNQLNFDQLRTWFGFGILDVPPNGIYADFDNIDMMLTPFSVARYRRYEMIS